MIFKRISATSFLVQCRILSWSTSLHLPKCSTMADLLGSILGSMEKPPSLGSEEKKKAKEQQKQLEKLQDKEKEKLNAFKAKMQAEISVFIKDASKEKHKFKPMDKVFRAIVHEVADVAGLTSFSFGEDEIDRYVMVWKKEFAPIDEELAAYRRGEEWDADKAKEEAKLKELRQLEAEQAAKEQPSVIIPASNYKDKYEHLIGREAAKDAAKVTLANKSYGFVSSENKRDKRTIEEVMAENKARKKLKESGELSVETREHLPS